MYHSLSESAAQYITTLTVRNHAERTVSEQQRKLNRFLSFLEENKIQYPDEITREHILRYQTELYQYVNHRGRPNTIAYQNGMLGVVKSFMRFLKERDLIITDPTCNVPYAKEPKKLPKGILTPSEARKIINTPDTKSIIGYRDRTILEVLYTTGIRKEEVNTLTLNDVDYNDGLLRVTGKGKKDRVVPLGRIACRYLENYIKSVRPEQVKNPGNHALFLSCKGNRLSKNVIWNLVKKYAKKAGIKKNVHPHTFRHTCATALLKNKADIRAVQELLGHDSLESTQIYTRLTIRDLKEVHSRCHPREKDAE